MSVQLTLGLSAYHVSFNSSDENGRGSSNEGGGSSDESGGSGDKDGGSSDENDHSSDKGGGGGDKNGGSNDKDGGSSNEDGGQPWDGNNKDGGQQEVEDNGSQLNEGEDYGMSDGSSSSKHNESELSELSKVPDLIYEPLLEGEELIQGSNGEQIKLS